MTTCAPLMIWLALAPALGAADDILLYERFEGATSGTIHGGVRFANDVVGYGGLSVENRSSARFDGDVGTSISFGAEAIVDSPDFTVEAFVKPHGNTDFAAIVSQGDEEGNQRSWALTLQSGNSLRFDVMPDGRYYSENKIETGNRILHEGAWSHVAAVSQGETSRLYVNGYLAAEKKRPVPGVFKSSRFPVTIGNVKHFAGQPRPFAGEIDELRITRRALTPDAFLKTREPMPRYKGPVPDKYDFPFEAKNAEEALTWQKNARQRLLDLVSARVRRKSLQDRPLDFKIESSEDRGTFTLHHATFQGNDGKAYPCLWSVPKGKGPFPGMLCLHGHAGSAEKVFDPTSQYTGFAERLSRGGYCALAPTFPHPDMAGDRLWDLMRLVDILSSRKEVDPQRLGVMGLSLGGEWTMWIGACDERLKVIVVSGWMCTTEGVFAVPNCACWELPGFVELMDVSEVHLLYAPRPALFESAESDPCFLLKYTNQAFSRIQSGYKVFGAEDAVTHDTFPGGHKVHGGPAYLLIDKVLGGSAARAGATAR